MAEGAGSGRVSVLFCGGGLSIKFLLKMEAFLYFAWSLLAVVVFSSFSSPRRRLGRWCGAGGRAVSVGGARMPRLTRYHENARWMDLCLNQRAFAYFGVLHFQNGRTLSHLFMKLFNQRQRSSNVTVIVSSVVDFIAFGVEHFSLCFSVPFWWLVNSKTDIAFVHFL